MILEVTNSIKGEGLRGSFTENEIEMSENWLVKRRKGSVKHIPGNYQSF